MAQLCSSKANSILFHVRTDWTQILASDQALDRPGGDGHRPSTAEPSLIGVDIGISEPMLSRSMSAAGRASVEHRMKSRNPARPGTIMSARFRDAVTAVRTLLDSEAIECGAGQGLALLHPRRLGEESRSTKLAR
jgi:hypothetical protein